jgi:ribose 5-phosphate isomerase B
MTDTIAIASDHGGLTLKQYLVPVLKEMGYAVDDLGTNSTDSVDYPEYAQAAAQVVLGGKAKWAVVICGTGIGVSVAANRFPGIRCALCYDVNTARMARLHNDANMLAIGGRTTTAPDAEEIVKTFARTEFEGGRHIARIQKIDKYAC